MNNNQQKELPEFLTDPASIMYDLNEDLLNAMDHLRYALSYAAWAGGLICAGSAFLALWLAFVERPEDMVWSILLLGLVGLVSGYACHCARLRRPLLEDYWVLGWGVHRANSWDPRPRIPDGADGCARFIAYLRMSDERFGYLAESRPAAIKRNCEVTGKSGSRHRFDVFMDCGRPWGFLSDPLPEGMVLMVREVKDATVEDVRRLRDDAQDVLARLIPHEQGVRVVLLQTGGGALDPRAVSYANENWMRYTKSTDRYTIQWSSPVEVVAEDLSGVYVFGNCWFG